MSTYDIIKVQKFISELEVIQSAVDSFVEENGNDSSNYGYSFLENIPQKLLKTEVNEINTELLNINTNVNWNPEKDKSSEKYYCLKSNDLKDLLGLEDIEMSVIINFETRQIISVDGININGVTYHRAYDVNVN